MTFAQWIGLYTIDIDRVAGKMVETLLTDYAPHELSYQTAAQFIRTRYMRLVGLYGLPPAAVDAVAEAGWRLIQNAGGVSPKRETFAFYE